MKKKLALLFSTVLLAITLTACGEDPKEADYAGKTYSDLENEMKSHLSNTASIGEITSIAKKTMGVDEITSKEVLDFCASMGITEKALENYGLTDIDIAAGILWSDVADEYGTVKISEDYLDDMVVTKSGKTTTADVIIGFENEDGDVQDVTFEIVYESWNMEISGISVNPVQTLGQKMSNAGMNTLISMAIVFAVLVLICLIIYAFNIFPYIEKKKKEKAAQKSDASVDTTAIPVVAETVMEESLADDYELVAVIAAAIAASEGCSTSDFVVRSINRR